MIDTKCNSSHIPNYNWSKANVEHIEQYQLKLNNGLSLIDLNTPTINCHKWHCECVEHRNEINLLCSRLLSSCIDASHETISMKSHIGKDVPGWDELVKPERDRSLFWHWMWQEAGRPQTVTVYSIMKRTRHQYHYPVRCCKKKLKVQKQKLEESISHSTLFWNEINKLNPTSKTISNSIDDANDSK